MKTTFKEPEEHTCIHCGHTGHDVGLHTGYVGGQGLTQQYECDDLVACWHRWDEAQKEK